MKLKELLEDLEKDTFIVIRKIEYADGMTDMHDGIYLIGDEQDMTYLNDIGNFDITSSTKRHMRYYALELKEPHVQPTYEDLKPYFVEETDLVNSPTHYNLGQIETREYILDVLHHNKHLEPIDGYYLGNILKYLSVRLGNKDDKLQDMKKAKNYLDKWIKEYEE